MTEGLGNNSLGHAGCFFDKLFFFLPVRELQFFLFWYGQLDLSCCTDADRLISVAFVELKRKTVFEEEKHESVWLSRRKRKSMIDPHDLTYPQPARNISGHVQNLTLGNPRIGIMHCYNCQLEGVVICVGILTYQFSQVLCVYHNSQQGGVYVFLSQRLRLDCR
jgi:hypothetical protein